MGALSNEQLLETLRWRYATKQFDPARKIPEETWKTLEQSLLLSPSSFGLQPWRFLVIKDPELRKKLHEASWKQRQIIDASDLVVFVVRTKNTADDVETYVQTVAQSHEQPSDSPRFHGLRKVILDFDRQITDAEWNARQSYVALGVLMTSAAVLGIDTCALEGIQTSRYDEILDLPAQGFTTIMVCALGYRLPGDKYATLPKVRFAHEEVIRHL